MNTQSLVISCPDKKGIVNVVTSFLLEQSVNIVGLEQHIEDEYFFMRVEWEKLDSFFKNEPDFFHAFSGVQKQFEMEIYLDLNERKKQLGLLCSKELHCVFEVLAQVHSGELHADISYIMSNSESASEIAKAFHIPFYYIPSKKGLNFEHESKYIEIIKNNPTDLIALARYMKVVSEDFIKKADQKIINVHHSFLPSFIGATPYDDAYDRGVKLIGATAHYVTKDLDQGPIIEQEVLRVAHNHTIENLKIKGRTSEKRVLSQAINKQIQNKIIVFKNRSIVFK